MFWAAASPAGWPPPPQNITDSHSETLCLQLVYSQQNQPNSAPLRVFMDANGEGVR